MPYPYQQPVLTGGVGPPAPPQGGSAIDPALIAQVLALQQQQAEQDRIGRQYKLAESMRGDGTQGLQGVQAGRRYVAPGIANLAGNIGQSFMGAYQGQQADQASAAQGAQKAAAMKSFFEALRNQQAGGGGGSYSGGYGGEY